MHSIHGGDGMGRSRRGLLAFGVAAVLLGSLLAACDGDGDDAGGEAQPTETTAPTGAGDLDRDGSFRLAWTVGPTVFDPHTAPTQTGELPFMNPIYDRLILLQTDLTLAPMLATEWGFSDDGSVFEMTLREGVEFHDGTPFNAEAVRANIERGQTVEGSTARQQLSVIESVEVVDDHTVRLHVTDEARTLPLDLAGPVGMMVSPAALDDPELDLNPVGTGPYVLDQERFRTGETATYVRAPGEYWGGPETQKVAEFTLRGVREDAPRFNGLRRNEIDIINSKSQTRSQAEELASRDEFHMHTYDTLSAITLQFNLDTPGLDSVEVRRALNMAVNREAIMEQFLEGTCVPTQQPLREGEPGYDTELEETFEYDPDAARETLEANGPIEFTALTYAGVEPQESLAEVLQAQFAEVGVTMNVEALGFQEAAAAWRRGDFDAFISNRTAPPDPGLVLNLYLDPELNPGGPTDAVAAAAQDSLFDQSLSEGEQEEIFAATNRAIVDDAVEVSLCRPEMDVVASSNIVGIDNIPFAAFGVFDVRFLGVAAG